MSRQKKKVQKNNPQGRGCRNQHYLVYCRPIQYLLPLPRRTAVTPYLVTVGRRRIVTYLLCLTEGVIHSAKCPKAIVGEIQTYMNTTPSSSVLKRNLSPEQWFLAPHDMCSSSQHHIRVGTGPVLYGSSFAMSATTTLRESSDGPEIAFAHHSFPCATARQLRVRWCKHEKTAIPTPPSDGGLRTQLPEMRISTGSMTASWPTASDTASIHPRLSIMKGNATRCAFLLVSKTYPRKEGI